VVAVEHLQLVLRLAGDARHEHAVRGSRHGVDALEAVDGDVDAQARRRRLLDGAESGHRGQSGDGRRCTAHGTSRSIPAVTFRAVGTTPCLAAPTNVDHVSTEHVGSQIFL